MAAASAMSEWATVTCGTLMNALCSTIDDAAGTAAASARPAVTAAFFCCFVVLLQ